MALTGGTAEAGAVLLEACQTCFNELLGDYYRIVTELTHDTIQSVQIVPGAGRGNAELWGPWSSCSPEAWKPVPCPGPRNASAPLTT